MTRKLTVLCCTSLLIWPIGPTLSNRADKPLVEIQIEQIERVSHEEVHFRLQVSNLSDQPVFVAGIKDESGRHLYPMYLEQLQSEEGWKIVAPCLDLPPPHVIKLDPGEAFATAPVLKLPLPSSCKLRRIQFVGKFRFRLEYFKSEKEARAFMDRLFSRRWRDAHAPAALSETFEVPPLER